MKFAEGFFKGFRRNHGNERYDEEVPEDERVDSGNHTEPFAPPAYNSASEEESLAERSEQEKDAMLALEATVAEEETQREKAREKARFARSKAAEEAPTPPPITQQKKPWQGGPATPLGGLTAEEQERRTEALRRTHGSDEQKAA